MNAILKMNDNDRWKAERDLDTMVECEKIEKDPKRKKAVKALLDERLKALNKVAVEMDATND
jgi:hypothetical protein